MGGALLGTLAGFALFFPVNAPCEAEPIFTAPCSNLLGMTGVGIPGELGYVAIFAAGVAGVLIGEARRRGN